MFPAVEPIGGTHQHGHDEHQHGITHQLVRGREIQQQGHAKLERRLAQADHGKGRHPLVCDDSCIIRHGQQADDHNAQRTLQHPAGGIQAAFRNDEPMVQPPHARRLHEQHQQQRKGQLDEHAGGEDAPQAGGVPLAQAYGQIAADGRRDGRGEEGEHRHHPSHDIVDAVIVDAQGPQHHTRGEQADEHQQEHTEIQQEGVASQPPAVFRQLSCSLRHLVMRSRLLRPAPP